MLVEMSGVCVALALVLVLLLVVVDLTGGKAGGLMASTLQLRLFAILLWAIANLAIRVENIVTSQPCHLSDALKAAYFTGY